MEITRLCESWASRLADASRGDQQHYAEQFLRLLGWEQPIPFTPREGAAALSAMPYLLRAGGQTTLTAFFVLPGTLEAPSAVVEAGVDFCQATRVLVDDVNASNLPFAFIMDFYRSYLYDARTEELLLHADDPRVFQQELVPVLKKTSVERGALDEVRRQPRSVVARQLRDWAGHWIQVIAREGKIAEETASLVIDRLLVARYVFERDLFRRTRPRLQARLRTLVEESARGHHSGTGSALITLFHDMWFDWRIEIFAPVGELDRALQSDQVAVPLLQEFALLGKGKFSIATLLESFNHGEPAEKLRVRMVPDANDERDHYLNRQTLDTVDTARIELDVAEEGYRAIFHWFDKVTALYDRLERAYAEKHLRRGGSETEIDLFSWSEQDQRRPGALGDKIAYACERGFGIYFSTHRQLRVSRLLLSLHLADLYAQGHQAINSFPSLEQVLMPRPQILSPDRVMNVRRVEFRQG